MAGDWLKMTHALPEKPEVLAIAGKTGLNRFEVVGRLFTLWRWFDINTTDGNASGVTSVTLNECLFGYGDATGFVTAVVSARWLNESEDGVSVVKFDEHISESAKTRAQTAKRVAKSKAKGKGNAEGNADAVTDGVTKTVPREEKRREDSSPSLRSGEEPARPTPGEACMAMKKAGMSGVSPSNQKLIALLEAGITLGELEDAARDSVADGKPFAYALAMAEGRRRDAATAPLPAVRGQQNHTGRYAAAAASIFGQPQNQGDVIDV